MGALCSNSIGFVETTDVTNCHVKLPGSDQAGTSYFLASVRSGGTDKRLPATSARLETQARLFSVVELPNPCRVSFMVSLHVPWCRLFRCFGHWPGSIALSIGTSDGVFGPTSPWLRCI